MNKADKAVNCFNSGYNCAQAVFFPYCDELGISQDFANKIASGFGAGMGRLQEVCGVITGVAMILSLKYGSTEIDIDSKEKLYGLIQEFNRRFKARYETIICKDLLKTDLTKGDKETNAIRVGQFCPKVVKDAVEILEEIIAK